MHVKPCSDHKSNISSHLIWSDLTSSRSDWSQRLSSDETRLDHTSWDEKRWCQNCDLNRSSVQRVAPDREGAADKQCQREGKLWSQHVITNCEEGKGKPSRLFPKTGYPEPALQQKTEERERDKESPMRSANWPPAVGHSGEPECSAWSEPDSPSSLLRSTDKQTSAGSAQHCHAHTQQCHH